MRLGQLFILSSLVAGAACGGTDPTASGVFPAQGFAGRKLRVEISGSATKWADGATVTFGAGVTVDKVEVASPTDLFADITIAPTAAFGPQDVTVSSGGSFTLKQAFVVESPMALAFQGDVAQGGMPQFTIDGRDFQTPFDLSTDPNTGNFTNLAVKGPTGTRFIIQNATSYEITGLALFDTTATSGALTISSGPSATVVASTTEPVTITARTATPFASPATGTFAGVGSTSLYSFSTTAGSAALVHLSDKTLSSSGAVVRPVVLGTTGAFADILGGLYAVVPSGGTAYLVVDNTGGAGAWKLTGAAETLAAAAEGTDTTNNTTTGALGASALPFEQTGGTVSSATDVDMIKFTIDAAHANKAIHVNTDLGLDANTDTQVEIVGADGTTTFSQGPQDNTLCPNFFQCSSLNEDVISDPLPAGTYYLKITAGGGYATSDTAYTTALFFD